MENKINIIYTRIPSNLDESVRNANINILSQEEKKTYYNFRVNHKKNEYLIGRILLKRYLSTVLKIPPTMINFNKNKYGKLYLKAKGYNHHFNLSHSNGLVIMAYTNVGKIGIDTEQLLYKKIDCMELVFTPSEIDYILDSTNHNELELKFYEMWTKKEAYIKCIGKGFSLPPLSFSCLDFPKRYDCYSSYILSNDFLVSVVCENTRSIDLKYELMEIPFNKFEQKWCTNNIVSAPVEMDTYVDEW